MKFLLGLTLLPFAAFAAPVLSVDPGVSGKSIRFDSDGNVYLEGQCFENVVTLPSGRNLGLYENAVTSQGSIYLSGSLNELASSFPGGTVIRPGGTEKFSFTTGGDLNLAGQCLNNQGCSRTKWPPPEFSAWVGGDSYWDYVMYDNNCYNYANDKRTDTFAQPGRASGAIYASFTVADVRTAALNDGLTWVGWTFPGNNYNCGSGHLVFMAVDPGVDYHWYRLDHNTGFWSHKPGYMAAINSDADYNSPITNPLTINRGDNYSLFYTDDGGFYCTCGSQAEIE